MQKIDPRTLALATKAPVKVFFEEPNNYLQANKEKFHPKTQIKIDKLFKQIHCYGLFIELDEDETKTLKKPKRFVLINPDLSPQLSVYVLLHEIGHAKCNKKNCKCDGDNHLEEYHADAYAMKQIVKNGWQDVAWQARRSIQTGSSNCVLYRTRKDKNWSKMEALSGVWDRLMESVTVDISS